MTKLTPPLKGLEIWACEWEDAHWNSGEMDKDDIVHRPVLYVSVGILLKDDETGVTTATDVSETGSFRGFNFIPAKMIVRKWKIGNVSPRIPRKSQSKTVLPSEDTLTAAEE
jgi:hypothetical protein